jgi:hypothetical protein
MPSRPYRLVLLAAGGALIVVSPLVGIIPGPGGIFVFAAGLVLVLRASPRARRAWVGLARRWPRVGALADRAMRRPSALRRHARARAEAVD